MLRSNLESILNTIPNGGDKDYVFSVVKNFPNIPLGQIDQNSKTNSISIVEIFATTFLGGLANYWIHLMLKKLNRSLR